MKNKLVFKLLCILVLTFGLITSLYAQNSFVYLNVGGTASNGFVAGFAVGGNGSLVNVPGSPFSTGAGSVSFGNGIVASWLGRLYVSGDRGAQVSGFSIDPSTGVLTPIPGSPFDTATGILGGLRFAITPDQQFLFALNGSTGKLATFRIGAGGSLMRLPMIVSTLAFSSNVAKAMKISKDGKFLFVAEGISGIGVGVFRIGSDGVLTRVFGTLFTPASECDAMSLELNCAGNLIFVLSQCGEVFVFNVATDGSLTQIAGSPFSFAIRAGYEHLVLNTAGNLMFVSNISSAQIFVLGVSATGAVSPVPISSINLTNPSNEDTRPVDLALNREDTLLYVNSADGTIFDFNISPTGMLSPVLGSPFPGGGSYGASIAAFPPKTCGPVFDLCIQDDSNTNILRINSVTGEYQFANCSGVIAQGTAALTRKGCLTTLQQYGPDKRFLARIDSCQNNATASLQLLSQGAILTIIDRNTLDDSCVCR